VDILLLSEDICNKQLKITMCPTCDYFCDYWNLEDTCLHAKVTYLFDNPTTVFFVIFMSYWGKLCLVHVLVFTWWALPIYVAVLALACYRTVYSSQLFSAVVQMNINCLKSVCFHISFFWDKYCFAQHVVCRMSVCVKWFTCFLLCFCYCAVDSSQCCCTMD
jgi:hypothetical protein